MTTGKRYEVEIFPRARLWEKVGIWGSINAFWLLVWFPVAGKAFCSSFSQKDYYMRILFCQNE